MGVAWRDLLRIDRDSGQLTVAGWATGFPMPYVLRSVVTGNKTLNTSHNIKSIIERHDGDGILTISESYDFSADGILKPRALNGGLLKIISPAADDIVTLTGSWDIRGGVYWFINIDLVASAIADPMFSTWKAMLAFTNVCIDGRPVTGDDMMYLRNTSFLFGATTGRDSVIQVPAGCARGIEVDEQSLVKFSGVDTGPNYVVLELRETDTGTITQLVTLDNSHAHFGAVKLKAYVDDVLVAAKADATGVGVCARRTSSFDWQNSVNEIIGFKYGIKAEAANVIHLGNVTGIDFSHCDVPIWKRVRTSVIGYEALTFTDCNGPFLEEDRGTLLGAERFSAEVSAQINDVTGDNTAYVVIFDSELKDLAGSYDNATGIHTVKNAGVYLYTTSIVLGSVPASGDVFTLQLITTGKTFLTQFGDLTPDSGGRVVLKTTHLAEMAAGDTAKVSIQVSGTTKALDVLASGRSFFQGMRLSR